MPKWINCHFPVHLYLHFFYISICIFFHCDFLCSFFFILVFIFFSFYFHFFFIVIFWVHFFFILVFILVFIFFSFFSCFFSFFSFFHVFFDSICFVLFNVAFMFLMLFHWCFSCFMFFLKVFACFFHVFNFKCALFFILFSCFSIVLFIVSFTVVPWLFISSSCFPCHCLCSCVLPQSEANREKVQSIKLIKVATNDSIGKVKFFLWPISSFAFWNFCTRLAWLYLYMFFICSFLLMCSSCFHCLCFV